MHDDTVVFARSFTAGARRMASFLLRTLALSLWLAMALSRNLLQSNWSAILRLTQSSLKEVNLESLFPG
ncbi:hypothetical protein [Xanthomonas arboricola]|uniref:hypothetical protein n=2 Tax=Xanthomonas arboricola TaxID=56448 RepID=UPI001C843AA7|nr:hypothetical protein [Xanthomonas arboricola]